MQDLISRQAAIDLFPNDDLEWDTKGGYIAPHLARQMICELPPAEPEKHTEERTETHGVCLDTIDRQAAIRWVKTECNPYGKPTLDFESGKKVIEHLKQMPSAQSERQKGEWIDHTEDGYVECPFCHSATNCDGNKDELHFCFSCGADMRGEQNG